MKNRVKLIVLLLLSACTHKPIAPSDPCPDLPAQVSFQKDIIPVFSGNCAIPGCHAGDNPQANLDLRPDSAYKYLTRPGKGYVDVQHPDWSILYQKLVTPIDRMPKGGHLDTCKIILIHKWIEQGAKNN